MARRVTAWVVAAGMSVLLVGSALAQAQAPAPGAQKPDGTWMAVSSAARNSLTRVRHHAGPS